MDKPNSATLIFTDGHKILLNVASPLPSDLVAFEERYDMSAEVLDQPNRRATWGLYLTYRIARRADPLVMAMSFEEFVEAVTDIVEEGVSLPDPTEAAPPTA